MYEIVNVDAAPASSVNSEIDPSLDAILLECLAKEPDERYQSSKEISKELKRFRREFGKQRASKVSQVRTFAQTPAQTQNVPAGKRSVVQPVLIGLLLLATCAFAYLYFSSHKKESAQTVRFALQIPDDLTVWSPDGRWLAFSSSRDGYPNLFRKLSTGAGAEEALHPSSFLEYPESWSPDGMFILFARQDPVTKLDIWILPLTGERNPVPFMQTEKELYYMNPDRVLMAVPVNSGTTFRYGPAQQLFSTHTDNFEAPNRYVPTKDGQRFFMNVPLDRGASSPVTVTLNWTTELTEGK